MKMKPTYLHDFLRTIFPHNCLGCGNALIDIKEQICFSCIDSLPYTKESIYQNRLNDSLMAMVDIAGSYAMCYYNQGSLLQELMKELKYRRQPKLGIELGKLLGNKLKKQDICVEYIVPVPLYKSRQKQRGYNQASKIANGVGEVLNLKVREDLLKRLINSKTQTNRTKFNRFENVENIFKASKTDQIIGRSFLIIDDVITTGATILSCANQLLINGANKVYVSAIGKADHLG